MHASAEESETNGRETLVSKGGFHLTDTETFFLPRSPKGGKIVQSQTTQESYY